MSSLNSDRPPLEFFSGIADLLVLNLAAVLCCIPVITAGASMTALHFALLKMVRGEEDNVLRSFFYSFRDNFRQATIIWGFYLVFGVICLLDLLLTGTFGEAVIVLPRFVRYLLMGGGLFAALTCLYVFPLLARFENTVTGTISNAARLVVRYPLRTLAMALMTLAFPAAVRFIPALLPAQALLGLSGPGYLCAVIYDPVFLKIEAGEKQKPG